VVSLERLSNAAVDRQTLIALEHRHRYAFAAPFCAGLRTVDLCCGVGYGTAMLAETAAEVTGIDVDPDAVDDAARAHGALPGVRFAQGDAVEWLARPDLADRIEALVCFEGIEHLADAEAVLAGLVRLARRGVRLVLSMPNSRRYEEDNAYHLTNFDRDAVDRWAGELGGIVVGQWSAEGSLIAPEEEVDPGPVELDVAAPPASARPRGWATHYLIVANAPATRTTSGRMDWAAEPTNARWLESMDRSNRELWIQNIRLAEKRPIGRFSAGAAAEAIRRDPLERRALRAELDAVQDRLQSVSDEHHAAKLRIIGLEQEIAHRDHELTLLRELRGRRAVRWSLATAGALRRARDRRRGGSR
jgi:SAM-dependent methyltransferase